MLDGKLPGGSVAMAANSSPSGAMNRPKVGPLVTVWLPVQSAFTVYVKGVTKFSSTTVVPIRTVTVAVPVPSPLKISDPASDAGVGTVTPNAGGRAIPELANRYRPLSVATLHSPGPSPFEAVSVAEKVSPAIATSPVAMATGIVRPKSRDPALR